MKNEQKIVVDKAMTLLKQAIHLIVDLRIQSEKNIHVSERQLYDVEMKIFYAMDELSVSKAETPNSEDKEVTLKEKLIEIREQLRNYEWYEARINVDLLIESIPPHKNKT